MARMNLVISFVNGPFIPPETGEIAHRTYLFSILIWSAISEAWRMSSMSVTTNLSQLSNGIFSRPSKVKAGAEVGVGATDRKLQPAIKRAAKRTSEVFTLAGLLLFQIILMIVFNIAIINNVPSAQA